jgi:hypothetical protein
MGKKPVDNFGIPPYHFGCRTIVRQMSSIQIEEMMLDEFGREYTIDKEIYAKIRIKPEHLKASKYKSVEQLLRDTMQNIAKEGTHNNDPTRRVIWGQNGFIVILGQHGDIKTLFSPEGE